MASLYELGEVLALVSILLVLLLNIRDALQRALRFSVLDAEDQEALGTLNNCHNTL
jgi:hypothetical protein